MVKDEDRLATRLSGLDLARFLAFVGMVVVNFSVVMGASNDGSLAGMILGVLEGRAAATFVVLAGIGMGLAGPDLPLATTMKRVLFLLVLGLLNMLIFPADIIHYYAFYFLFGSLFVGAPGKYVGAGILGLVFGFLLLVSVLDYDAGWNWQTLSYSDFWTVSGFARNLFFNGWHPVVPWLAFFLFGILIARLRLSLAQTQGWMMVAGLTAFFVAEGLSDWFMAAAPTVDGVSLQPLVATKPVPPGPLYMIAGMGIAMFIVGGCLRLSALMTDTVILKLLCAPGRQTLTLYFAHIVIGMGVLEALGLLADQHNRFMDARTALGSALMFSVLALLYAVVWSRFFRRGPVEALMRRLC